IAGRNVGFDTGDCRSVGGKVEVGRGWGRRLSGERGSGTDRSREGRAEACEERGGGSGVNGIGDKPGAAGGVFVGDHRVVKSELAVGDFGQVVGAVARKLFELSAKFVAEKTDGAPREREGGRREGAESGELRAESQSR